MMINNRTPLTMPPITPPTEEELARVSNAYENSLDNAVNEDLLKQISQSVPTTETPQSANGVYQESNDLQGLGDYLDPETVQDQNNSEIWWKDNDFRKWLEDYNSAADARSKALTDYNYEQMRQYRATAYQDTVKDLRAAGLNPVLAYSNGASSGANGFVSASQASSGGANSSLDTSTVSSMMSTYISSSAKMISDLAGDLLDLIPTKSISKIIK